MPQSFFWIHKDAISDKLSQSSRQEESEIRRHVQTTRKTSEECLRNECGVSRLTCPHSDSNTDGSCSSSRNAMQRRVCSQRRSDPQLPSPIAAARSFPSRIAGLSPAELRGVNFFQFRTSREWAGWSDFSFWSTIALQLAERSKTVAHSLISLSAFHESLDPMAEGSRATALRQLSISQSSKAAKIAAGSDMTYLEALTSCLILFCYHSLWQSSGAFSLLKSGMMMLAEYDRQTTQTRLTHVSTSDDLIIEDYIRPLFDHLRCRPCRMGDLAAALRLSVQHQRDDFEEKPVLSSHRLVVSTQFQDIAEARHSLQAIFQWAHDSLSLTTLPETATHDLRIRLRLHCAAWESSLKNMGPQRRTSDHSSTSRAKKLLQIASLSGRILIETHNGPNETVYDDYISEFNQIIQFAEEVVSGDPSGCHTSFGIDSGFIDILAYVGSKCRDPWLRRRAMNILLFGGRMEGDRLGYTPGLILEALVDLEERDLNVVCCGDIPETRRRSVLRGHVHLSQRLIRIFFSRSHSNSSLEVPLEESYISLPGADQPGLIRNTDTPDAIFGCGYAAFLEDRDSKRYFRLSASSFLFPIPRV